MGELPSTGSENFAPQETLLQPNIARGLGRGLAHRIGPQLDSISSLTPVLPDSPDLPDSPLTTAIVTALRQTQEFLLGMQAAEEVRVVPHGGSYTIRYSQEQGQSPQGVTFEQPLTLDPKLTKLIRDGLTDRVYNLLAPFGFAELLADSTQGKVHDAAVSIMNLADQMKSNVEDIFNPQTDQYILSSDNKGNVFITCVPKDKPISE